MNNETMRVMQILIGEWQSKTFGKVVPKGQLKKLSDEASELKIQFLLHHNKATEKVRHEAADVAIVLLGFCERMGFDLSQAIAEKMEINRSRKWGARKEDGTYQHL